MKLGYFTMPLHPLHRDPAVTLQEDREAIIRRHLTLGFTYDDHQIRRAMEAVTDHRARQWDHRNRPSARST